MADVEIAIEVAGLDEVGRQVPYAASRAMTNTAFGFNARLKDTMQSTFKGGATPYTLRAWKVTKATTAKIEARVDLRHDSGGKAASYDKVYHHLFTGGTREWKRMEGAFRRIGVLWPGMSIVPGGACPLDSYGNPPRSLIVQLIAYFQAFGEVGYKANMTDKRKARLAKRGKSAGGYKTINGVEYFVSRGKGKWYGRYQHLPAGIWARRGIHGSDVAPVFRFVRRGTYDQVINLEAEARAYMPDEFSRQFAAEFEAAVRSAR